jgi:hypothetical protein
MQTGGFRPYYVTLNVRHPLNRTFDFAPIPAIPLAAKKSGKRTLPATTGRP